MRKKLLLAAGLVALLLVPLIFFMATRWTDIPPPDDSDLVLPAREVDPAQNPFPEIRSFQLEDDEAAEIRRAWRMINGDEDIDGAFITRLLEDHSESLSWFDAYSGMTDWREDQKMTIDVKVPYIAGWMDFAKLKAVQGDWALREKRMGDAIEAGMSTLRFAEGLHHAEGGFFHQLVSGAIANIGMIAILRVLESGELTGDQLKKLDRALAGLSFSPETYAEAHIVEYLTYKKVADDLAVGKIHIHQLESSDHPEEPAHPPTRFFYKRNMTVDLLADAFREFVAGTSMIRSEAPEKSMIDVEGIRGNTGALYFSGNLIGNILFSIVIPSGAEINDQFAAVRMSLDLLRVRIGMEQYRLDKGAWPKDLESLVPEFVEKIPVDLMDGQPIRYSKENQVIYSVGSDFVDDGGIAPDQPGSLRSRKEIVIDLPSGS